MTGSESRRAWHHLVGHIELIQMGPESARSDKRCGRGEFFRPENYQRPAQRSHLHRKVIADGRFIASRPDRFHSMTIGRPHGFVTPANPPGYFGSRRDSCDFRSELLRILADIFPTSHPTAPLDIFPVSEGSARHIGMPSCPAGLPSWPNSMTEFFHLTLFFNFFVIFSPQIA